MKNRRQLVLLCVAFALSSCITRDAFVTEPSLMRASGTLTTDDSALPPPSDVQPVEIVENASADHFTFNSTMDHVARVMGTPSRTVDVGNEVWWYYGYSQITFRNGRVAEWGNTANNLKVKIKTSAPQADYFTQGATMDQVVAAMGTPTRTAMVGNEIWWHYGYSQITFKHGRVSEWANTQKNLKVRWCDSNSLSPSSNEHGPSASSVIGNSSLPRLSLPSQVRSSPYVPTLGVGYVTPHYRSGGFVQGYFRKNGTYVSPHYRSGGSVRGHSR